MYINWKAICEIRDRRWICSVVTVDLNTADGLKFAEKFPEYFTDKEPPKEILHLIEKFIQICTKEREEMMKRIRFGIGSATKGENDV